jgi:hypothetical protein
MSTRPTCTIDGCDKTINAKGLCHTHYKRFRKHGDPSIVKPKGMPVRRRFPLQPLLDALSAREGYPVSDYRAAQLCGVFRNRLVDWRKNGIAWSSADRVCVEVLGSHPLLLWPDFYDDIDTSEDVA